MAVFPASGRRVLYDYGQNPAISVLPMKHRPRPEEQDDLLRPRLVDMIDPRHELVKLAALIDWEVFQRKWAVFFPSRKGRPATDTRLVAGRLDLQHAYWLSDEAVVARWVENPYYQHFTWEAFFQHRPPIDASSLTRWRKRIGEEGVEWMLIQTVRAGQKSGVIGEGSARRVAGRHDHHGKEHRPSHGCLALRARAGTACGAGARVWGGSTAILRPACSEAGAAGWPLCPCQAGQARAKH